MAYTRVEKQIYFAILDAAFTSIGKPQSDILNIKGITNLFGSKAFPAKEGQSHYNGTSIKKQMVRSKSVIQFLIRHDYDSLLFYKWCGEISRNPNSEEFFEDVEELNIETFVDILDMKEVQSPTHLEFLFRTLDTNYYYKAYNSLKKPTTTFTSFNNKWLTVILLYLGYRSIDEFIDQTNFTSSHFTQRTPSKEVYTTYKGYYYDFVKNEIRSFTIEIDYNSRMSHKTMHKDPPNAKQYGLHGDHSSSEYIGNAYILNHKIHIILWCLKNEHGTKEKVKFILTSDKDDFQSSRVLKGLALASTSINDSPISIECFLTREDMKLSRKESLRIERYLNIRRNNILVNNKSFDFNKLKAKNVTVDRLEPLVGVWHIIRYDEKWNLLNSLMMVDKNYRITCFTATTSNKKIKFSYQNCYIEPAEKNDRVIYLSCMDKFQLVSQLSITRPKKTANYSSGVMIIHNKSSTPFMRGLAMYKIPQSNVETFRLKNSKSNKFIKRYLKLSYQDSELDVELEYKSELIKTLNEITIQNTPKANL